VIILGDDRVGKIAAAGAAEIIHYNKKDSSVKDTALVVPIVADRLVYGLIYSQHSQKHFFTRRHQYVLQGVADVSAVRISKYYTEERLRSKIAQDLHDDLGSALSSININSKMALESTVHPGVKEYLQKIKNHSGSMMESMSDIVWAIDPQNDTLEKVIIRMKEFAAEILEPLNVTYRFIEALNTEDVELDLTRRKNFYLLFKECINNVAKYSACTQVEIEVKCSKSHIWLSVIDNGKGFDPVRVKSGNGLRNMNERAADMSAVLEINSVPGNGTTVQLKVPIT
jgi:signal transduction histidine kinase